MPLSSDSVKALDNVKKSGTPCRFVLISKGPAVVSVVVYRKGTDDARILEAKKVGTGDVACGVVDGQGPGLSFKLLRADGFEEPPVKKSALNDFLNAENKLNLKANIEIVDVLPEVELEWDPLTAVQYRSSEDWKSALGAIQTATDPAQRAQLLGQAVRDYNRENSAVQQELRARPQSPGATAQAATLAKVAGVLRLLASGPAAPPSPGGTTPTRPFTESPTIPPRGPQAPVTPVTPPGPTTTTTTPQATPSRPTSDLPQQAPPTRPVRPTTPPVTTTTTTPAPGQTPVRPTTSLPQGPAPDVAAQRKARRAAQIADATSRVAAVEEALKFPYPRAEREAILKDCQLDATSEFGQIVQLFGIGPTTSVDKMFLQWQQAQTAAEKFIKKHTPLIGKPRSADRKPLEYCQKFIDEVNAKFASIPAQSQAMQDLCAHYQQMLAQGNLLAPDVATKLEQLARHRLITVDASKALTATASQIVTANQQAAYGMLKNSTGLSDAQQAEILLQHGCCKGTGGGTSGVKLLTQADGNVAYAFKPLAEESEQGLTFLGLPAGASGIREALTSAICAAVQAETKIDLGFPNTTMVRLDGKPGALIAGIHGEMADPEERADVVGKLAGKDPGSDLYKHLDAKRQRIENNLMTLADQVSADSLQNVVLSSIVACQWDCKWGNMIVEGDRARPIDGGTSLPTVKVVKGFRDPDQRGGPAVPAIQSLVSYPTYAGNPKSGQFLPQAAQPMPAAKVKAILEMDAKTLVAAARTKRDELVRSNPELNAAMVDDTCFQIMHDSIVGAQQILRKQPDISLADFAIAYEKWFADWGDQLAQST